MKRMNILILGCAQHGKDDVADYLVNAFGIKKISSSWYTGKVVFERMRQYAIENNRPDLIYKTVEECHADRGRERVLWKQFINEYNTPDLTRLTRELYEIADIYVGLRNEHEFLACCKENLYDLVIFVDAKERKGIELESDLTIPPGVADIWVDNNGTLEDLAVKMGDVVEFIKGWRALREAAEGEPDADVVSDLIASYGLKVPQAEINKATDWLADMLE